MVGREKSDACSDFSKSEEEVAKIVAKGLDKATTEQLNDMTAKIILKEICNDKTKC